MLPVDELGLPIRAAQPVRTSSHRAPTQRALRFLAQNPGATVRDLAQALGCTHQWAGQIVKELRSKGYVTCRRPPRGGYAGQLGYQYTVRRALDS